MNIRIKDPNEADMALNEMNYNREKVCATVNGSYVHVEYTPDTPAKVLTAIREHLVGA